MATNLTAQSTPFTESLLAGSSAVGARDARDARDGPHNEGLVDPRSDILGLIDLDAFARLQNTMTQVGEGHHLGSPTSTGSLLLGQGASYSVRRVSYRDFMHSIDSSDDPFDPSKRYVVVKQPLLDIKAWKRDEELKRDKMLEDDKEFERRLYAVMLELRILSHAAIKKHPNIVKLHHFMWDTQNHASALAPSLILEYADLGTLSDFQDPDAAQPLPEQTKLGLCCDVAEGLSFLHKCGIIHGDVKSRNVLLFRDGKGIRAKLSDFGCSLIEVFDEPGARHQCLPGRTIPWDAPEPITLRDALGLRRTDIYSYGLLAWRIMCDGRKPYKCLCQERSQGAIMPLSHGSAAARTLSDDGFQLLKHDTEDRLLQAAIDCISAVSGSETALRLCRRLFRLTLRVDPSRRARSMDEIVTALRDDGLASHEQEQLGFTAEPLRRGDFGLTSPSFPASIYRIRTAPPTFRTLICDQLERMSRTAPDEKQRATALLALAVCHEQGLHPSASYAAIPSSAPTSTQLPPAVNNLIQASRFGNPLAQSLTFSSLRSHGLLDAVERAELSGWLVSSMGCGSIRAREDLETHDHLLFDRTVASILHGRERVASGLTTLKNENGIMSAEALSPAQIEILDLAARAALGQPGLSPLHTTAYLGALGTCETLLEGLDVAPRALASVTPSRETPLHFAAKGGQVSTARLLLQRGADVNAQTKGGATALHLALMSFHATKMVALLLENGADPNILSDTTLEGIPDRCDYFLPADGSPLHFAVSCEDETTSKILLEAGANPNMKSARGITPLQVALGSHSLPLLKLIVPYATTNPDCLPDFHSIYPFLVGYFTTSMTKTVRWHGDQIASVQDAVECFRSAGGIDLDDRGILAWALDSDNAVLVDHYLGKLKDAGQLTPYRYRGFGWRTTGMIVDVPIAPDLAVLLGNSIGSSSPAVILAIIKHMATPFASDRGSHGAPFLNGLGLRPLTTLQDVKTIASVLVAAGADPHSVDEHGNGPLSFAVNFNNYDAVDALLDYPLSMADVQDALRKCISKSNSQSATRMMRSIIQKCPQVLVPPPREPGLDPINQDGFLLGDRSNYIWLLCGTWEFGRDDAINSARLGDAIQKLTTSKRLPSGIDVLRRLVNEEDIFMQTALHHAARSGNAEATAMLLESGVADVNYSGHFGLDATALPDIPNLGLDHDSLPALEGMRLTDGTQTTEGGNTQSDEMSRFISATNRGQTPLDCAMSRNWERSILLWMEEDRAFLQGLRDAGGARKEEREYNQRTAEVIRELREHGGKTKDELFGLPDRKVTGRNSVPSGQPSTARPVNIRSEASKPDISLETGDAVTTESVDSVKPGPVLTLPSHIPALTPAGAQAERKIMRMFSLTCGLPSFQMTSSAYPRLTIGNDPDRPPLSSLSTRFAERFTTILADMKELIPSQGNSAATHSASDPWDGLQTTLNIFSAWDKQQGVSDGRVDSILLASLPSQTVILAAAVFACLAEVDRSLQFIQELVEKTRKRERIPIDFRVRFGEFLEDLRKAVDALAQEESDLRTLADLADERFRGCGDAEQVPVPNALMSRQMQLEKKNAVDEQQFVVQSSKVAFRADRYASTELPAPERQAQR